MFRLLLLLLLSLPCRAQAPEHYYSLSGKVFTFLGGQRLDIPVELNLYTIQRTRMISLKGIISQSLALSPVREEEKDTDKIVSYMSRDGQGHPVSLSFLYREGILSQVAIEHGGNGWLLYIIPEMEL